MFKRLLVSDLTNDLTLISFLIFFLIFVGAVIWTLCIPRSQVQHMEELPLDNESSNHP